MAAKICRDCSKCTERGITSAGKKSANAVLIGGTLGMSVVGSKLVGAFRKKCPQCGHPLSLHAQTESGAFKD